MQKIVEFLLKETPEHAKEIYSAIGLLLNSIENTQSAIEGMMKSIDKNDYAKLGEYYSMGKEVGKLKEKLSEIEKCFGFEKNIFQGNEEKLKDYEACRVDETVAHGVFENFIHKRPAAFSLEGQKYYVRDWKQVLRMICELLNQRDSEIFDSFTRDTNMQGSSRTYFAYTDNNMNNGIRISGSNVYIETARNADCICKTIVKMLDKYNIPVTSVQIYLRSDYTSLHEDSSFKKSDGDKTGQDGTGMKIGKYAKEYFTAYFNDKNKSYDLKNFLNKYWCNDKFGISYPLLKEVNSSVRILQQWGYDKECTYYWAKPVLEINGKQYIMCKQWYKKCQEKLDKWIEENG
ncbi:MAG: hypothetical protein NC433_06740 [Clostridiales bacterium]|nr:hypothetical protein [Clostridiales bacterium]